MWVSLLFHTPLLRALLEKKSASHGNVTATVLYEQKMMLIYFQQSSVLDWDLCYRVQAILRSCYFQNILYNFSTYTMKQV